jgi:hypothetical protein
MKKLLLFTLMLLASSGIQAKFYKATLNFTDGTSRTGYAEAPAPDDNKIKFRTDEKGKPETIESALLSSLTLAYDKGGSQTFLYLYPAQEKKKGVDKEKNRKWFGSVYMGKINFVAFESNGHIATGFPGMHYYIHIPGNDYALYFNTKHAGATKVMGEKKLYRRLVEWHFKDICPELVNKFTSEEYETKDMDELIEFYKKTCE